MVDRKLVALCTSQNSLTGQYFAVSLVGTALLRLETLFRRRSVVTDQIVTCMAAVVASRGGLGAASGRGGADFPLQCQSCWKFWEEGGEGLVAFGIDAGHGGLLIALRRECVSDSLLNATTIIVGGASCDVQKALKLENHIGSITHVSQSTCECFFFTRAAAL
mmetsp:Transcript_146311/g.469350  ORF Transcript_146311/g.469350 Transcript_146311/m.469350 type:complete len:163 (+) Transcript_146311:1420-1908(+)